MQYYILHKPNHISLCIRQSLNIYLSFCACCNTLKFHFPSMAFNFSNLERQMYENGIDLLGFTVEQAMKIANFISIDYHNRRLRCGFVLRNDCLTRFFRFFAYWYLYQLLELLAHNTPFSVVDESLAFEILQLIGNLKWFFEGAWWSDLEAFLLDHEKYSRIFVEQLEYSEKLLTEISEECWLN